MHVNAAKLTYYTVVFFLRTSAINPPECIQMRNERTHVLIGVGFGEVNTRFWNTFPSFQKIWRKQFRL